MKTTTMTPTTTVPFSGAALLGEAAAACPRLRAAVAPVRSSHATGLSIADTVFDGTFGGGASGSDVPVDATGLLPRGAPV